MLNAIKVRKTASQGLRRSASPQSKRRRERIQHPIMVNTKKNHRSAKLPSVASLPPGSGMPHINNHAPNGREATTRYHSDGQNKALDTGAACFRSWRKANTTKTVAMSRASFGGI